MALAPLIPIMFRRHCTAIFSGGAIYGYKTEFNVRDKANITHNIARPFNNYQVVEE